MDKYPERPSYWAMRVQREFFDLGEHVRLGTPALAMLFVVVIREDEARYRRPVYYQNEVFAGFLGWGEKTMRRVRQSLIDSGWLHYEAGKRGSPGVYWSLLPTHSTGVTSDQETGTQPQKGVTSDQLSDRKREGKPPGNEDQTSFLDPKPLPKPKGRVASVTNGKWPPPEVVEWCDWWNGLQADGFVHCGVRSIKPGEEIKRGWEKVKASADLRELLSDRDKLETAIKASDFVIGARWFTLDKLFGGRNKQGALIVERLLDGGYGGQDRNGGGDGGYDDDPRGNKQTVRNYWEKLRDEDY